MTDLVRPLHIRPPCSGKRGPVFFIFVTPLMDGSHYKLHIRVNPVLGTVWGCWGSDEITDMISHERMGTRVTLRRCSLSFSPQVGNTDSPSR